ncbi:MAG: DUF3795 domain-containing protein [Promethearchaeota archaeon]
MNLKLEDVKEEDRGVLSPCGIACLGCDSHVGEGIEAAKKLKAIWEGSNLLDTAMVIRLNPNDVETTLKVIDNVIKSDQGKCPGCFIGSPMSQFCGIAQCVKSKDFWTCAECNEYDVDSETPCPQVTPNTMPMADKGTMTQLLCSRYDRDTVNNLKKCREIGYTAFIEELKKKVNNGWRTWQVISNEMVFTNTMKK